MSKKVKVLVNGHDQKFWYPLQRTLETSGKYIFKEDMWSGHNTHDEKESQELLEWADIIICEWALGNAVYYTQQKLPHQKLIIRLHLQERDTEFPKQINYDNVNAIIFVGQHILDECVQKFNIPKHITYLIPNIIDVKKFDLKKFGDANFTLGIVGIVPLRKRLDLAYETLKELQKIDKRYMLRIKGASPASYDWLWARTKERAYYEKIYSEINASKLRYSVIFDPMGDDVAEWFQSVGYILSPSDFESFHVAPAEGMSSTTLPIIWKREGSSDIFPTVIKTNSPQLAAQQIDFYRRNKAGERYKQISKEFILNTFDSKVTSKKWAELLDQKHISDSEDQHLDSKKKVIVFFAIGSWETFHRKEMIEALAKHIKNEYNILIIEPGNNFQAIVNNGMATENELLPMLQLKPTQVNNNIFKIRIMNSGFNKNINISKILTRNSDYGQAIYAAILEIFGKNTEILYWIQKSLQYKWINQKCNFIFEVYDEYTMDFDTGKLKKDVLKEENSVLPLAQHVFFTSEPLAYRKSSKTKSWSIVGNGVNFDIFSKYRIQKEINSPKRASVGYLGNLSNFFNWELICEVVEQLPEIDFIFYGQMELENMGKRKVVAEKLISYPNTLFTGRVTREEGAVGVNLVDILIIPFVINDAMHAVNPLKLWEYFATGKPVISTPMDAIAIKEPLLRVASSDEEWITAINNSLLESDISISKQRTKLAKENSWDSLTAEHTKILKIVSKTVL